MKRRDFVLRGASLGGALALPAAASAAPAAAPAGLLAPDPAGFRQAFDSFVGSAPVVEDGLLLEVPALGDNPAAVPVKVRVTRPITEQLYCEEIVVLADLNPAPLACRFRFTPATGTAEAAFRIRLSQSQTVHALARMSDGQVLAARQAVEVGSSGCGM
ncbi:thiosulfate oxidation carrier protein SoxY [Rubrivivax gelatinosus]|uniref:Sulfur-oxidizing protein SoxY n=1 Tax=Rubrivivax gelatinosus TaxID=28068 RepID=A0A4V2SH36_RUBGE|nr:thiosulfate oxidation carrier protein SoxY [Rubrivivax gelatinosus]MBK1690228.1 sulfur oxidation protein SoxY [Rubrivivax gelatinosus]TCP03588.1 sulfur-oxidizing protein SoxY [Rubrivivax gelatinosus]